MCRSGSGGGGAITGVHGLDGKGGQGMRRSYPRLEEVEVSSTAWSRAVGVLRGVGNPSVELRQRTVAPVEEALLDLVHAGDEKQVREVREGAAKSRGWTRGGGAVCAHRNQ